MANIQIKNVPDEVHAELRRRADEKGMTIRDYLIDLLRRDQSLPTWVEWRGRWSGGPRTIDLAPGEAADIIHAERERAGRR